jgi:hypothetical protein
MTPEHRAGPDLPAIVLNGQTLVWKAFTVKDEVDDKDYKVPGSGMGRNRPMHTKPLEIEYTSLVPFEGAEDYVTKLVANTDVPTVSVPGRTAEQLKASGPYYIKSSNYDGKIDDLDELKITVMGTGKGTAVVGGGGE